MTSEGTLRERLEEVRSGIEDAAVAAGRQASDISLIVVTKFHPIELVHELRELGVNDFGESRHQEAREKAAQLPDATWHFVGQLQSNKAKQVRDYARVIHSVDRLSLVDALARTDAASPADGSENGAAPDTQIFVQIDLADDPKRGGTNESESIRIAERIVELPGLQLLGVMAVAPLGEDPRRAFARLLRISERIRSVESTATAISAGMSGDYHDAISEGATHLRIGTAITGERPPRP